MNLDDTTYAWTCASVFALLYARNVAKCYHWRKKAEFWRLAAQVGTAAGFLGGVFVGHKGAQNDAAAFGLED